MPGSRRRGRPVAAVLVWMAVGVGSYTLFSFMSGRQTEASLASAYRTLAANLILAAAAMAAAGLPSVLVGEELEDKVGPGTRAAAYVVAGIGLWRALDAFSVQREVMGGLGLVCLSGGVALAVSHLAVYVDRHDFGGAFAGLFRWLAGTRSLILVIGLGLGFYAFLIRPAYAGKSTYSTLIEWIVITLAGLAILGVTRIRIGAASAATVAAPDWPRHRQQVLPRTDSEYVRLKSLQRRFVEEADPTLLVHDLATLLERNGVSEGDAADVLRPMLEYQGDHKERPERQALLNSVAAAMQSAAQPSRHEYLRKRPDALDDRPVPLPGLVAEFCAKGDLARLFVRLSSRLAAAGIRSEDVEEVLRPLTVRRVGLQSDRRERERRWQDVAVRAARRAPTVSLKE